jgi:phage terminase large subunit-like protein
MNVNVTPKVYVDSKRFPIIAEQNARVARASFEAFRRTMRRDMLWNPFVLRLTRELQRFGAAFEAGKRPKLILSTPAQHGKSTIAEDFAAWISGRNPNFKTIFASYSEDLGIRMSLSLQRTMISPRYRQVFPHMVVDVPGWTFNTSLTEFAGFRGNFRATTINGPITGLELDLGILDDFVKGRAEANSKVAREKTWHWFTDDFLTRFSKDSALFAIATRWHIDDLFGRLQKKWPELVILNFPALAEKDEGWRNKGDPLFPEHKPLDFLLERKQLMSEASWSAEYQGKPFLTGSGAIPIEKLSIVPFFDYREVAATVVSVDKAGIEGGDGAATAIVTMHKMKDGRFVIERVVRGRWGALEREQMIKAVADDTRDKLERYCVWPTVVIEQEPGSGGLESAQASLRNLAGHTVILDKPGAYRSKEVRAEPFCAMVQGGQMGLHAGGWIDDFLEECGNWPMGLKDQVDAAAQAFTHLTGPSLGPPLSLYEAVNR